MDKLNVSYNAYNLTAVNKIQIDLLKAVGLLLIILAHVDPGYFLMQLRVFDVPLMVLISGYLSVKSFSKTKTISQYYLKRLLRLYLPTALFLTFFFLFYKLTEYPFPFSWKVIYRSYFLLFSKTIGYVWIIRVFLLCTLITPLIIYYKKYIFSKVGILFLFGMYVFYEFLINMIQPSEIVSEFVFYALGYGIVLVLGMALHVLSKKSIYILSGIFGFIYCCIAGYLYYKHQHYISVQNYKYPPQIYYLSYSLCVSFFLYAVTTNINLKGCVYDIIKFISRYSLSIYLWHIFFLYLIQFNKIILPWYILYIIILISSSLMAYILSKCKTKFLVCKL